LEDQSKDDLKFILSTPQGKRFLYKLLSHCGVYQSSFDNSGSKVYFNEGQRSVGLHVLSEIEKADENGYFNILKAKKEILNG
jgi:hypothetical protein